MRPFVHDIRRYQREREPGVLIGTRRICQYCQIGPNTFYRWQRNHTFPATLTPDGRWMTSKSIIDNWIVERWKAQRQQ